jgi:hypothetical protein
MQATGVSIRIRFKRWKTAFAEPAAWNFDVTDAHEALQSPGALGSFGARGALDLEALGVVHRPGGAQLAQRRGNPAKLRGTEVAARRDLPIVTSRRRTASSVH